MKLGGCDRLQDLHPAPGILPALLDGFLRQAPGLRAAVLAGAKGEQCGIRPTGNRAVQLGGDRFQHPVAAFELGGGQKPVASELQRLAVQLHQCRQRGVEALFRVRLGQRDDGLGNDQLR